MLDYPALATLAAVVREGGFERAAARLGVTPSAVSQRVRALEERVGGILVVRGQPPVATGLGTRLIAHLERVRILEGDLASVVPPVEGADPVRPTVRVAVNADSLAAWFMPAAARFAAATDALLDLALDDEGRTADRLRSGEVVAAVTADPVPVPGCRIRPLGALRYVAVASPGFHRRHFADGIDAAALSRAPILRFDGHDRLQDRWARVRAGVDLDAPTHWVPSAQGFLEGALLGLGWAMNPLALAGPHLAAGRLVELLPGRPLDVPLHWQAVRLGAGLIDRLTRAVTAEARARLVPPG